MNLTAARCGWIRAAHWQASLAEEVSTRFSERVLEQPGLPHTEALSRNVC